MTPILTPVSWQHARSEMFIQMFEREQERFAGWKVYLLTKFFPLPSLRYPAVIGTFSWSSAAIKRKWIMRSQAISNAGTWVTPGDIARDYLAIKYENRRVRCTSAQYTQAVKQRHSTPIFCEPMEMDYAYYVDIHSAYWSICQAVGWDCNYLPGNYLAVGERMDDFPFPDNKMARNCLVSVGLPGGFRFWTGSKLTFTRKANRFINLILWRLVCDVLNGIALDCVKAGATYVYTDGYIVSKENLASVCEVLDSWAMPYRIKREGRAIVRAPADYEIGGYHTNVIRRKMPIAMDTLYEQDNAWLRRRIQSFGMSRIRPERLY